MSGSLEESVPLVDAHAAAAPTATDRAQHQSRRSSLKTTLAVGLACALLVAAAIVWLKSRDAIERTAERGRARGEQASSTSRRSAATFTTSTASGGGFSCLPAMSSRLPERHFRMSTTDCNDGREHKITPRDCACYQTVAPVRARSERRRRRRARRRTHSSPLSRIRITTKSPSFRRSASRDQKCFMDRYILITTDAEATRKCEEEKLFHCLQYADGHAFDGLVHHGGHAEDKKYSVMTWFKQKVTLGLLAAGGMDFFFFDTDVILFKVPDLALLVREHPRREFVLSTRMGRLQRAVPWTLPLSCIRMSRQTTASRCLELQLGPSLLARVADDAEDPANAL